MTDRYNIHSQLEHLQSKYIGTGHADTSKWEWLVNQHRDSYCSYMGHFDLLNYFSVAENESKARVRFNLMEKMLQPCGPPVDKPDDSWFVSAFLFFFVFFFMFHFLTIAFELQLFKKKNPIQLKLFIALIFLLQIRCTSLAKFLDRTD